MSKSLERETRRKKREGTGNKSRKRSKDTIVGVIENNKNSPSKSETEVDLVAAVASRVEIIPTGDCMSTCLLFW